MLVVMAPAADASLRCPAYGLRECAGQGKCVEDGQSGFVCECDEGYAGADCAVVLSCDPRATRLPCGGRGVCRIGACDCAPGYSGALCESDDWCPLDPLGRRCSNVGVCSEHTCVCPSHRSGVACELGDTSARAVPAPI